MTGLVIEKLRTQLIGPVSFVAQAGSWTRIRGTSGSGKSLLMRAIADLDHHQGMISLDSKDQQEMPASDWRRQVQYVATDSAWWADIVGDHFNHVSPDLVHQYISQLGFTDDVLSWPVMRLSSGERQRLALVRSLALQPKALLLDESWSHVDPDLRQTCIDLINQQASRNCVIIAIAHDDFLPTENITLTITMDDCQQVAE